MGNRRRADRSVAPGSPRLHSTDCRGPVAVSGWIVLAAAAASSVLLASLFGDLAAAPASIRFDWMPSLGVAFHLRADPFGLFFALLIVTVGVLVTAYSLAYLRDEPAATMRRYYAALATFMGAMVGIALADDLILLFVFWEITSLSSFLLIGHRFENAEARSGAVRALLVTSLGGIVMMVGFLLLGDLAGTFSIRSLVSDPQVAAAVRESPLTTAALLCILCGAFTKSAQFPFHFWLPKAMVAPTPISAYLHAATMVKAGVFLVARLDPVFASTALWSPLLIGVGGVSLLLGAWQTSRESDLKAILARGTGAALGGMMLMYGLGGASQDSLQILSHALYKGALFLLVGVVEHRAHTREIDELGGMRRQLPVAFAFFVVAALSMGGIPPLLGFVSKEGLLAAVLESPHLSPGARTTVLALTVVSGAFLAAAAWRMTAGIFLGRTPASLERRLASDHSHHEGEGWLVLPPAVLSLGALFFGLAAAFPSGFAVIAAAASHPDTRFHLSSIPHAGPALAGSVAALAGAALLVALRKPIASAADRLAVFPAADRVWDAGISGLMDLGSAYSRRWENGSLRWYLGATLASLPVLVFYALDAVGISHTRVEVGVHELPWPGLVCCAMLVVATVTAVTARTRLAAAITTTVVGFLVAMVFVVYRSPDILLTQVLIESVSTIFLLLVLVHLPPFRLPDLSAGSRLFNGFVAVAVGASVTLLLLLSMTPGLRETDNIATRPGGLLERSFVDGGGQNSVNVIIVDLRALDTTGEVTVLVVVGLCIFGLLRARRFA
jgi:multicomponent Na+:H+ antiporter subunit A